MHRAHVCRADAYARIHDYDSAVKDITRAIRLRPSERHLYLRRGKFLLQLKKLQLAAFCVRHIATLEKVFTMCYMTPRNYLLLWPVLVSCDEKKFGKEKKCCWIHFIIKSQKKCFCCSKKTRDLETCFGVTSITGTEDSVTRRVNCRYVICMTIFSRFLFPDFSVRHVFYLSKRSLHHCVSLF